MTDTPRGFAADADTMIAIVSAMNALATAVVHVLTPEQQQGMAQALAWQANKAEEAGDIALETLLMDMHRIVKA